MNITFNMPDHLALHYLTIAQTEELDFEDVLLAHLEEAARDKKLIEMTDEQIDEAVQTLLDYAIEFIEHETLFKVSQLHAQAMQEKWSQVSPNARKTLGRRFMTAVGERLKNCQVGETVVMFVRKDINNASLYKVTTKPWVSPSGNVTLHKKKPVTKTN